MYLSHVSLAKMCQTLKVSTSGYYQWCSKGPAARLVEPATDSFAGQVFFLYSSFFHSFQRM
jgi:hypothetical protein